MENPLYLSESNKLNRLKHVFEGVFEEVSLIPFHFPFFIRFGKVLKGSKFSKKFFFYGTWEKLKFQTNDQ